jgi:hypothetical protein
MQTFKECVRCGMAAELYTVGQDIWRCWHCFKLDKVVVIVEVPDAEA